MCKYCTKNRDILFSAVAGSVDRCSYVSAEYEGWMFSGRCLRARPCEKLNPEYLYYFFLLEKTKQFARNIATGATMPSINTKFMGEIPIRVPSLDAQNKIASILWMIDDKIELNKR
ncbi:MAG: restriction endonuclease subunit S [Ruminococcus sp.]